ncbi:MAG TPA: hypothetical protein VM120_25610 [Bryobacteraceae bacterium]|nr:hypothetical protein [Bryobacteraceae bacterium]
MSWIYHAGIDSEAASVLVTVNGGLVLETIWPSPLFIQPDINRYLRVGANSLGIRIRPSIQRIGPASCSVTIRRGTVGMDRSTMETVATFEIRIDIESPEPEKSGEFIFHSEALLPSWRWMEAVPVTVNDDTIRALRREHTIFHEALSRRDIPALLAMVAERNEESAASRYSTRGFVDAETASELSALLENPHFVLAPLVLERFQTLRYANGQLVTLGALDGGYPLYFLRDDYAQCAFLPLFFRTGIGGGFVIAR